MTEDEWLACTDPAKMVEFLRNTATERKLRLFVCACCRTFWSFLTDLRSREAVEAAERYADGLIKRQELRRAAGHASNVHLSPRARLALCAASLPSRDIERAAYLVADDVGLRLLRDLLGNPFRRVANERRWLTATVVAIASAAYDERAQPSGQLDRTRLAILADALEDAGCQDHVILGHLRADGTHMRGCYVLDALLGKR
jgi:hypothetical protein